MSLVSALFRFFVRRLLIVLGIALVVLGLYEYLTAEASPDWTSVVLWSALAATLSAGLATWTNYRRGCRV
jgi:hypothetical protein